MTPSEKRCGLSADTTLVSGIRLLWGLWLTLGPVACASSGKETSTDCRPSADSGILTDGGIVTDSGAPTDSETLPVSEPLDYEAIFVQDHLATWELKVDDGQWVRLLADPKVYVEADLTVEGKLYPKVGLRILGKTDRVKVSMRLRFDQVYPDQTFHGVKRLNLHASSGDTSLIREALALSLMREAGVPASRRSFVWMSTNQGQEGVYTLIEQVDKKFLSDRFGENTGNLYKGERGAGLLYLGDDQALYPDTIYELKTNEDMADRSDLVNLIKVLNRTDPAELDTALPEILDMEGFLRWLAVNTWLVSMDSYAGTVDNYYLYHGQDGRFRFIPWDLSQAFGSYHGASCTGAGSRDCTEPMGVDEFLALNPDEPFCPCSPGKRPLIEKLLARPVFRDRYHEILGELIDGALKLDKVKEQMQSLRDQIEQAAHLDTQKDCYQTPCTNAIYDAAVEYDDPPTDIPNRVPGLVPFIEARDQTVRQVLGAL